MVPATPSSLSDDGFLVPCTPGGAGDNTTGREKASRADPDGPETRTASQAEGELAQGGPSGGGIRPGPLSSRVARRTGDEEAAAVSRAGSPAGSMRSTGTASILVDSPESDVSVQTTASGTAKRLRSRGGQNTVLKKGRIGRSPRTSPRASGMAGSSSDEDAAASQGTTSPREKKRGRPPTTGEGLMKAQRERAKKEVRELQEQSITLQRILGGSFEPREEWAEKARRKKEEELEREMRSLPPRDIAAQMVQAARQVEETAAKSGNLKGGYVRLLKDAALAIEVGVDALITRGVETAAGETPSVSTLRAEVLALGAEMRQLRKENADLRRQLEEPGRGGSRGDAPKKNGPPSPLTRDVEMRSATSGEETPHTPKRRTRGRTLKISTPSGRAGERDPFPALRPAIRGVRMNLDEPFAGTSAQRPSHPAPSSPPGPRSGGGVTEEKLEERLRAFQTMMLTEMRSLLLLSKTGARGTAPKAAERGTAAQPPPPVKGKGGKTRGGGKAPLPPQTTAAPSGKKGEGPTVATANPPSRPARQQDRREGEWSKVVGRREKRTTKPPPPPPPPKRSAANGAAIERKRSGKRRVPRTSAIAITGPKGEATAVMAKIRAKVPLATVGLTSKDVTTRRGVTGATIVEVGGPEHSAKADALASAIRLHLAGDEVGVRVDRPTKTADIRVRGLEASITPEEVVAVLADEGGCPTREIKAGGLRAAPRGTNTVWVRMPLASAKKVAASGSIHVGWTRARVELLDVRPLRCFKCLERGHARAVCPSPADRSGRCYRCSGTGHTAKVCAAPPKCPLCSELGRRAGHVLGAPECAPTGRRGGTRSRAPVPAIPPPTTGSTPPASGGGGGAGLPPAEEGESPKLQRRRRRTTRPLSDDEDEAMDTEGADITDNP